MWVEAAGCDAFIRAAPPGQRPKCLLPPHHLPYNPSYTKPYHDHHTAAYQIIPWQNTSSASPGHTNPPPGVPSHTGEKRRDGGRGKNFILASSGRHLTLYLICKICKTHFFYEKRISNCQQSKLTKQVSLLIIFSALGTVLSCWQPQPLPFANELRPHCQAVNTTGTAPASCPDGLHSFFSRGMRSRLVGGRKAGGTEP